MGRGLSALSVGTFSEIVESDGDDRDEAGKEVEKKKMKKNK